MQKNYQIFKVGPSRSQYLKWCSHSVLYSAHVLETQLVALDEIIALSVEDPVIRNSLTECDLRRLSPTYGEADLIISMSKALGSLDNAREHNLWSLFISSRGRYFLDDIPKFKKNLKLCLATLRCVHSFGCECNSYDASFSVILKPRIWLLVTSCN